MTRTWTPLPITGFRRVGQDVVDAGRGDCMQACVASLLGLDRASEVPPFHPVPGEVPPGYQWLSDRGLWVEYQYPHPDGSIGAEDGTMATGIFPGYAIASVPSARFPGSGHAVIVLDGVVVWDPSPFAAERTIPYEPVDHYYRLVRTESP